jgi:hypothetical protein
VRGATAGDPRDDAPLAQRPAVGIEVVAAVGEQLPGLAPRPPTSPTSPADGRDGVEQRQQLSDVVVVATGERDSERDAVSVDDQVVRRARMTAVDRRGSDVVAPLNAGTCEDPRPRRAAWLTSASVCPRHAALIIDLVLQPLEKHFTFVLLSMYSQNGELRQGPGASPESGSGSSTGPRPTKTDPPANSRSRCPRPTMTEALQAESFDACAAIDNRVAWRC